MRTVLLLALAACHAATAAPGTGAVRDVGSFHGIDVATVLAVEVTVGPAAHVELHGPKEWVDKITTQVDHDVLRIALPNDANHVPKLSAVITVPDLTSLSVSGVASIHATKIAAKAFDVSISGTGSMELSGTADTLHVNVSGTGQLDAKDLTTRLTALDVAGAGEATIRATKQVDANVSGAGDITILGNPATVNKHVSGVASIH